MNLTLTCPICKSKQKPDIFQSSIFYECLPHFILCFNKNNDITFDSLIINYSDYHIKQYKDSLTITKLSNLDEEVIYDGKAFDLDFESDLLPQINAIICFQ